MRTARFNINPFILYILPPFIVSYWYENSKLYFLSRKPVTPTLCKEVTFIFLCVYSRKPFKIIWFIWAIINRKTQVLSIRYKTCANFHHHIEEIICYWSCLTWFNYISTLLTDIFVRNFLQHSNVYQYLICLQNCQLHLFPQKPLNDPHLQDALE